MAATNSDLLKRRDAAVPRGVSTTFPAFADRADNAELWDVEGRRFIDFAAGIAVLNTGHRHPTVLKAAQAQSDRITHAAFQVMGYESYIALAERLNGLAPVQGPAKTLFITTGAEAVENAIKIARAFTNRPGVVSFSGAFHGRTLLATALTGKAQPYKQNFGPFPTDLQRAPFPAESLGISVEVALAALDRLFRTDLEPQRTAAIILEPVQGEGGFHQAPVEFLKAIRAICDQHGILLIADEVQSGFARTGKMFAIEHSGVKPDLITVAKGIAGGFPLAGVIGRAAVMDAPLPGGLGGTYGGNPVSCAAALGVLDAIVEDNLQARAVEIGATLVARLEAIRQRNDSVPIGEIRGIGAMVAFDLLTADTAAPDPEAAKRITQDAFAHGLILLSCGVHGNTVRLLPPLSAADDLVSAGMDILERCLVRAPN